MKHRVTITVDSAMLQVICGLLADTNIPLHVEPVNETTPKVAARKRPKISAPDLIMSCLERGVTDMKAMEVEFVRNGFASTSVSPTVSYMRKEGKVERNGTTVSKVV